MPSSSANSGRYVPEKHLIGMVHVGALPSSPLCRRTIGEIVKQAAAEAVLLAKHGFDAVMIENMHDAPYVHGRQRPVVTAAMTACGLAVQEALEPMRRGGVGGGKGGKKGRAIPLGVQVLSGGNHEALSVALACGAAFIRCENFVFAHVGDEGLMAQAEAGELLRYRREIGAEAIAVFTDLKKKHASHAITGDVSIGETAEAAAFFGSDGFIVTGTATGKPVEKSDLHAVRAAADGLNCPRPVLVGSGVTAGTVGTLLEKADGLIVGSSIKREGRWFNPPDARRVERLASAAKSFKSSKNRE